jgi:hypothetical protein
MVDDVFFWHTGAHIKMMSRKRDVALNGMCKEAVVFSGVCSGFGVDRQSQRGSRV